MTQRIRTLAGYFMRHLLFSVAGALYALLALVFWIIFFDPRMGSPEMGYYILMTGTFGALITFLVTLTTAARANRAIHYPILVRLPSRMEYLAAVLIGALGSAMAFQILVAILATFQYDSLNFTFAGVIQIPIVWLPVNILAATMALHA